MASLNVLQGNLGQRRAAHLLRRASFRYTIGKVDHLAGLSAEEAVTELLMPHPPVLSQPVYDNPLTPGIETVSWINPPGQGAPDQDFTLQQYVIGWWLHEAMHDPGMTHKMSFFWHQYMAAAANTITHYTFFDYLALLKWCALGNFKKLANKIVTDNTMLRYLNNDQNTVQNPNENFAREFLELFTIGKGPQIASGDYTHYTEDDIVQAARVFTGFRTRSQRDQTDPETGIPRGVAQLYRHDMGSKTFSEKFQHTTIAGATSATGMFTEVAQFVDMILAQPETARNICRRLYRFFVRTNISDEVETGIIEPLADTLRNNNYDIAPVLKKLLKSEHFYDADDTASGDEIYGSIIKSPLDLVLPALSFFSIDIPDPVSKNYDHYVRFYTQGVVERMLGYANLPIFYPADVAGYAAYHQEPEYHRNWFNSSTIIARYKFPQMLFTGQRVLGGDPNTSIGIQLDLPSWVRDSGICSDPADAYVLVGDLLDYMLPASVTGTRFEYFCQQIFLDNLPPADWSYEWQHYLSTGNGAEVKIALERLVQHIMFSPEYQTF